MTVRTWNKLVSVFIVLQVILCIAVVASNASVNAHAAAMTWLAIGVPCMFGFIIQE